MKKIFLLFLLVLATFSGFAQRGLHRDTVLVKHRIDSVRAAKRDSIKGSLKRDSAKLGFSFNPREQDLVSNNGLLIDLEFKNKSGQPIRLVDLFDDLSLNFYLSIKAEDGAVTQVLKGPATDPRKKGTFKYIDIAPGQVLIKTINLYDILKQNNIPPLAKGIYHINLSYLNRAGKNCIVGLFKARPRKVKIME